MGRVSVNEIWISTGSIAEEISVNVDKFFLNRQGPALTFFISYRMTPDEIRSIEREGDLKPLAPPVMFGSMQHLIDTINAGQDSPTASIDDILRFIFTMGPQLMVGIRHSTEIGEVGGVSNEELMALSKAVVIHLRNKKLDELEASGIEELTIVSGQVLINPDSIRRDDGKGEELNVDDVLEMTNPVLHWASAQNEEITRLYLAVPYEEVAQAVAVLDEAYPYDRETDPEEPTVKNATIWHVARMWALSQAKQIVMPKWKGGDRRAKGGRHGSRKYREQVIPGMVDYITGRSKEASISAVAGLFDPLPDRWRDVFFTPENINYVLADREQLAEPVRRSKKQKESAKMASATSELAADIADILGLDINLPDVVKERGGKHFITLYAMVGVGLGEFFKLFINQEYASALRSYNHNATGPMNVGDVRRVGSRHGQPLYQWLSSMAGIAEWIRNMDPLSNGLITKILSAKMSAQIASTDTDGNIVFHLIRERPEALTAPAMPDPGPPEPKPEPKPPSTESTHRSIKQIAEGL